MLVSDCLRANRDEIFQKDGCQHWFKLILNDLGRNHSEAVVLPYRTWPEPCLDPKPDWPESAEEAGEYKDYVSLFMLIAISSGLLFKMGVLRCY